MLDRSGVGHPESGSRRAWIDVWVRLACACVAFLPLACARADETRIVVVVTADPEIRARTSAVGLVVIGDGGAERTELRETRAIGADEWPLRVVIVPRDGDASRTVELTLDARGAQEEPLARVRAAPSFVPARTVYVELHLAAACLGVLACGDGYTCEEGRCTAVERAPVAADAGTSIASPDAAPPPGDAGAAADARTCVTETCDGTRDDDCDGRVDEGCECSSGETRVCPEGGGRVCVPGAQSCAAGRWGACVGRVEGRDEECNALDDDCDGRVDEELRRGCGRGCHRSCALGLWGACRDDDGICRPDDD